MSPGRFITGIFIDAHGRDVCNVAVRDELSCYYDLIGCDLIDIVRAKIGESTVAIVCDDEGKLRADPRTIELIQNDSADTSFFFGDVTFFSIRYAR